MTDPLTVFGAAAGGLQLADLALRLSKELFTFFCDVKSANGHIKQLTSSTYLHLWQHHEG